MNRFLKSLFGGLSLWMFSFASSSVSAQGVMRTDAPPAERLKFVLVLTRHGVRSPTWTNARLDEYSAQPWPVWPVAPGLLTPHGKQLMNLFGGYYRASFAQQGLLSPQGCEDAAYVFIYTDSDERTIETGHGLVDGMFPGCTAVLHSLAEGVQDSLFHPDVTNSASDPNTALSALSGRIGNDAAALQTAYEMPLQAMQHLLSSCTQKPSAATTCDPSAKKDLLAVKASLALGKRDHLVEMKGPLPTSASFAENFQLEYLEGMPENEVGWGHADAKMVASLMLLHAASSDLVQRTPYLARAQASNLLNQIAHTLEQAELRKAVSGAIGNPGDKAVFLVGHDTNIANVAALLDAHWLVSGYQRDDAAPGGALVFALWQRDGLPDAVRVYYTVQTPSQMRLKMPLSLSAPPARATVFLPGCSKADKESSCDWTEFRGVIEAGVRASDTSSNPLLSSKKSD